MKVYALLGESGTGKSHQAMNIAHDYGIKSIIDDGLLISDSKRLAGTSAKREHTRMAAVKRAIFFHHDHRQEVRTALEKLNPESILILGTSDRMIENIAEHLGLHGVDQWIRIEDVSTQEEIRMAKDQRVRFGKHIIPLPTLEIKREFSGYFLDAIKTIVRRRGQIPEIAEKSVVRPTFSYLGKFSVSNRVLGQIAQFAAEEVDLVADAEHIRVTELGEGLEIHIDLILKPPYHIIETSERVQIQVAGAVEDMTRLRVLKVFLYVKSLKILNEFTY